MTTPLTIEPRNLHFGLGEKAPRYWHGEGPAVTHFYNALSLTFPAGERFFMDSVKHYRDRITDPKLQADIKAFLTQEAIHSREHAEMNRGLTDHGYPVEEIEADEAADLDFVRNATGHKRQLAVTCALEHFTAILANRVLQDPRYLAEANPAFRRLWRWHALEESEHKAVAFDVYQSITGGKGYRLRCWIMVLVTIRVTMKINGYIARLMKHDGLGREQKAWKPLRRHLFGRRGLLLSCLGAYLSYFRPGFHPWDHDNAKLVDAVRAEFAETEAQPA